METPGGDEEAKMSFETTFSEISRRLVPQDRIERYRAALLKVVDLSLAGCVFVVPFLLGGRQAAGRLALVVLAVTAAGAWLLRQCLLKQAYWRRSAGHLVLAAAVGLVVLQLVPWPADWLARLSPRTTELLPLWTGSPSQPGTLGTWSQISLAPTSTSSALVIFLAYGLIFWVTVQRIRSLADVERLLHWIALATVAMAAFGIVQYVAGNGKFYWVYEHPYAVTSDSAKGAFTNRNHFAHFLALGLGAVIWWVQQGLKSRPAPARQSFAHRRGGRSLQLGTGLRVIALGIVVFALLLSFSRGGAIAAAIAGMIAATTCWRAGAISGKFAASLAAVALLLAGSLLIFGHQEVSQRLGQLTSGSLEQLDKGQGRRAIWKATLAAAADFRLFGSGAGTFQAVYPIYMEHRDQNVYYTHAESGYLQVLLETGLLGLGLVAAAIAACLAWCLAAIRHARSKPMLVCAGAVAAPLAASAIHGLVDFVWYVPGCMTLVALLAASACRLRQLTRDKQVRRADAVRLAWPVSFALAVLLVGVGTWMIHNRVGPFGAERYWNQYRTLERVAVLEQAELVQPEEEEGPPAETDPQVEAARRRQASVQSEQKMLAELEEVVRWQPDDAQAHVRLAGAYLRLFHHAQENAANRMPLGQIRDAALAAGFTSRQELDDWLARAIGDQWRYLEVSLYHTRRGLALCPLEGEAYLYLGELCFLEGGKTEQKGAYLDQALRVRPHSGTVLFHAGREAWLAGQMERGIDYWKRSFRAGPMYQRQMINWFAGRLPAETLDQEIQFFLDTFEPDLYGLKYMVHRYRQIAPPEKLAPLLTAYARRSIEAAGRAGAQSQSFEAAQHWLDAMAMYVEMGDTEQAARCAWTASQIDPNNFRAHYKLGFLLADAGHFAQAEEHLAWCNRRKPNLIPLKNKLLEVKKHILDPHGLTADPGRVRNGLWR